MPVPAAVERVRESAGTDATIAHAPGSVELLGETCAATGGMLLATALPVSAAVALEPNDTGELTVISTREETSLPMPDAVPAGYPAEVTAIAAAVVAMQHTMHLIPRTGSGLTVRWASTIPAGRGLGEIAALQSAVALAANARWGDRDDVPTRARLAAALHETAVAHYGDHWPLHPYTAALRSRPDSVLTCNHADEAVTQNQRPDNLALMVAYSPDITGASPQVERHEFFADACSAFGVPTLHGLPEAQPRVLEWVRARREVHPDGDAPTVGRATKWLDDASGCSDRARAVSAHLRHGDTAAAMAGIAHDVAVRDTAPSPDSPLGRLVASLDGRDAVARCCPARGAAVVVWAHADDADDVEAAIRRDGGTVLRVTDTDAGTALNSRF
ncbi:MAG TPA: hypothetical protein K8V57_04660 [Corynebacterium xerosis]|uniref:GHMP family kinase ATP-binding protein n=1 Tax=Corynebacterium xerosis TaxID=1725 RepID=UPI001D52BBC9|nr:galactokinase family protein [Corynebacterium xerosis]HJG56946.1 hypothetical protein [Corynebacterium xerosis]